MPRLQTERVSIAQRYRVRGNLPFPIDMLRYDAAYPASEEDSYMIAATHNPNLRSDTVSVDVRTRAAGGLTVGRWESFGWTVVPVSL